jgi:hypothetical protein
LASFVSLQTLSFSDYVRSLGVWAPALRMMLSLASKGSLAMISNREINKYMEQYRTCADLQVLNIKVVRLMILLSDSTTL